MEQYPWFYKLNEALKVYYKVFRRLNMIVNFDKDSEKEKIADLKELLEDLEDGLIEAENIFLQHQFPRYGQNKMTKINSRFMAGPVYCSIILN